jgi:hypothetical protein
VTAGTACLNSTSTKGFCVMSGTVSRVFLVGIMRSGTTLLQSLLAANTQVASCPETMFFRSLVGENLGFWRGKPPKTILEKMKCSWSRCRERLGFAHSMARWRINSLLSEVQRPDLHGLFPAKSRSMRRQAAAFAEILDRVTIDQGKTVWVEKSPEHIAYIDLIERYVRPVKFIHIVRNGADVVASLTDVGRQYPKSHWKLYWDTPDKCIALWNEAIRLTRLHMHKPHHHVVRYERLVDDTPNVLAEVCDFLSIPYQEAMVQGYSSAAERLVRNKTAWQAKVFKPIENANGTKFFELFDDGQQQYILNRLSPITEGEFERRVTAVV